MNQTKAPKLPFQVKSCNFYVSIPIRGIRPNLHMTFSSKNRVLITKFRQHRVQCTGGFFSMTFSPRWGKFGVPLSVLFWYRWDLSRWQSLRVPGRALFWSLQGIFFWVRVKGEYFSVPPIHPKNDRILVFQD
jgi:hypothetical protein